MFLVLALMAAGTVIYIAVSGGTFTDVSVNFSVGFDDQANMYAELDKEGVLEIENAYPTEDGHPCVEMRAPGEGNVTVLFFTDKYFNLLKKD